MDGYEGFDYEAEQARRDEAEYQAGLADGRRRSAERAVYGDDLAEQFAMADELAAYNAGLEG